MVLDHLFGALLFHFEDLSARRCLGLRGLPRPPEVEVARNTVPQQGPEAQGGGMIDLACIATWQSSLEGLRVALAEIDEAMRNRDLKLAWATF